MGVDARGLKGLGLEQHTEQEDVRAEHERRVVDDL
jgi:hypothetical protein